MFGPIFKYSALLLYLLPTLAQAMEWLPEFQSLDEAEQLKFETPHDQSTEYQADLLTYLKPNEWNYLWLTHDIAVDLSYGSIGAAHFMADRRIKLRASPNSIVQFRLTSFDESNRDRESVHTVIESVFRPLKWKGIGVSLYADPSLYKRNLDTGIALLINPTERHEIRIFNTFIDTTRYRRSDRPDYFALDALPNARGIVGRTWSDPSSGKKDFLEYAIRRETPTRWEFPREQYTYRYWKNFASLYFNKSLSASVQASLRVQWDRKFESRSLRAWTTERVFITAREDTSLDSADRYRVSGGAQFANRTWKTESGTAATRALLPFVELQIPTWGDGVKEDHFHIGYVLAWSRAWGPRAIRGIFLPDPELENRLNLAYDLRFNENSTVRLQVSVDLDERPRYWWEGGNLQAQMAF